MTRHECSKCIFKMAPTTLLSHLLLHPQPFPNKFHLPLILKACPKGDILLALHGDLEYLIKYIYTLSMWVIVMQQ